MQNSEGIERRIFLFVALSRESVFVHSDIFKELREERPDFRQRAFPFLYLKGQHTRAFAKSSSVCIAAIVSSLTSPISSFTHRMKSTNSRESLKTMLKSSRKSE